jgi:hypothetical protein
MKLIYSYILASILVFIATTIIMLILNQDIQHSVATGGITVVAFLIISFIQYLLRSE